MTKKSKIIIITVASVLAVAIIVGLVLLITGKNDSTTASSSETTVSTDVPKDSSTSENVVETVEKIKIDKDSSAVTIDDIEGERGKEISVPITISNNPGIMASAIEFQYNTKKLTYIGYTPGEVFENYVFKEMDDSICYSCIENGDVKKDGLLFNLKFKVKEDAVLGDTEIKVNVTDESFINFDEEFIKLSGGNAVVTIK